MEQQVGFIGFPDPGSWGMFAVLLLMVYLATKASRRTIGIVLGALILLPMLWSIFSYRVSETELIVDSSAKEPAIANKELWDRLTKSRIKLEAVPSEKPAAAEKDKDQATEEEDTESTPAETKTIAKPDWVENPPKRMGNLYSRVVVSGPYSTVEECHLDLETLFLDAVRERIQTLVAGSAGRSALVSSPLSFGIGLDYIMREICQPDEFIETVSASFGEMKQVHVLMEFSPAVDSQLRTAWKQHEQRHRLFTVGKFAVMAFSLLAVIYGGLQFDTWTRGYYTKRLLIGVSAAIILVVILNFA